MIDVSDEDNQLSYDYFDEKIKMIIEQYYGLLAFKVIDFQLNEETHYTYAICEKNNISIHLRDNKAKIELDTLNRGRYYKLFEYHQFGIYIRSSNEIYCQKEFFDKIKGMILSSHNNI